MNHLPPTPEPSSLLDLSTRDFLALLASSEPAPGGGAAAALTGALGTALVAMTANLTVGRKRFAEVETEARRIVEAANAVRLRLEADVVADAHAYEQVSAAYRLPRGTDAERQERAAAVQVALVAAAEVPLRVCRACAELLALSERAVPILNANVISDVVVGAQLALSALESAAVNVEVNLRVMDDRAAAQRFADELAAVRRGAAERQARVAAIGRSRMPGADPGAARSMQSGA